MLSNNHFSQAPQQNSADKAKEQIGLFRAKPANAWMQEAQSESIPCMLFAEFWHEGELCLLFAETNAGKSIVAVNIADSISSGVPIEGFAMDAPSQPVLYLDFEFSKKQFEGRYSNNYQEHYVFNNNLIRVELDPDTDLYTGVTFEEYLYKSIAAAVLQWDSFVLIIDNITYLKQGTETARDALPLMKQLKALKKEFNLSILALAHTPKRNRYKPLEKNDLQGSKMLINFCDSSFAIGESQLDPNLRYLKQIKQRNTAEIYGANNVCKIEIVKPHNFLGFKFLGYDQEFRHLQMQEQKADDIKHAEVLRLKGEGLSYRQIEKQTGVSSTTVGRWLDKAGRSGS